MIAVLATVLHPEAHGLRRVDVVGGTVWLLRHQGPLLRGDLVMDAAGVVRPYLGVDRGCPLLGSPVFTDGRPPIQDE